MKKAVTIKDIAGQLNLSRNTVAKALNGQYVPEATRKLVLDKAREMNYKSLDASRAETGARNYRLLLVSGKPLNNMNYFVPLIRGIENYCYDRNYELFQYTYNNSKTPFKGVADYIRELNADGIVAIECFEKEFILKLLNLGKPICFNDFSASEIRAEQKYDVINANNEQSVSDMVVFLHKKYGITKFSFVGDSKHCLSFQERYMGMRKALMNLRLSHTRAEDILADDGSFDYGNPSAIKTEILKLRYKPECFICCNDFVARTVANALKLLGEECPKDALIVGFDNVSEAVAFAPALTSFSVEKEFMGRETIRTLVNRIDDPSAPSRSIYVSASPVFRASTLR